MTDVLDARTAPPPTMPAGVPTTDPSPAPPSGGGRAPRPPGLARTQPRHAAPRRPRASTDGRGRRLDIEGLRAIAVLGVLGYHAGLPFVPGGYVGVDVFFVISGFLITGLVAGEVAATGRLSFGRFYARRIRRLLPAAALVLVVTAVASAFVLSPLARGQAASDIVAAALYVSNWSFAAQQTDYLATTSPSPVLHYWSLSVEEQYYVLWPLVLVAAVAWARRRRLVAGRAVLLAVVLVGGLSLAWSLVWTTTNPPYAFFGTMTRAWELALGGVIALTATTLGRRPHAARAALGWAGLGLIVWSMATYSEQVPFPGAAALVPTLGAAAVLVAGLPRPAPGPTPLGLRDIGPGLALGLRPMRAVGRVSYSLYLWHWPPLVLVAVALGRPLSPVAGVLVVLASAVPAVVSYRYVEEPFRRASALVSHPKRAFAVAAVLTAAAVLAGVLLARTTPPTAIEVTRTGPSGAVETVTVDPATARADVPGPYGDDCHASFSATRPPRCVYGDERSDTRVALLGDSHAVQWFPAVLAIAKDRGWALELDTKSACSPADVAQFERKLNRLHGECPVFREAVLQAWEDDPNTRPDVVLVASRNRLVVVRDGQNLDEVASLEAQRDGLARTFDRLADLGIQPVLIRDVPYPRFDVPECLARHTDDVAACAYPLAAGLAPVEADVLAAEAAGVPVVDLTSVLCPNGSCQPINDGVLVYRDDHHVTASLARSLTPRLADGLRATPVWAALRG